MLNKIYAEQKITNRNLKGISNIVMMGIFAMLIKDAKARGDIQAKKLCRIGVCLTAVSQGILIVSDIIDLINHKNLDKSDLEETQSL